VQISQTLILPTRSPEEKKVEALKVHPDVHAGLEKRLQENPSGVPLDKLLGRVGANAAFSLGSPVGIAKNVGFFPIAPNAATDPSSITDDVEKLKSLLEQFPWLPPPVEKGLHVIGLLLTVPDAWTALVEKEPGPGSKVEVDLAIPRFFAALVPLIMDVLDVPAQLVQPAVQNYLSCLVQTNENWCRQMKMSSSFLIVPGARKRDRSDIAKSGDFSEPLGVRPI
jgi:hypothetical protein